jgi:chromosome segregation ATPase
MIKKIILIIFAVAAVAAGIFWTVKAREPSPSEAQADFCSRLEDFNLAVLSLRSIDQNSTPSELKDARNAVQQSWEALQKSASSLKMATMDSLDSSYSELENTIQKISGDPAVAEAQTDIYRAALDTLSNTLESYQETCKPSRGGAPVNVELLP